MLSAGKQKKKKTEHVQLKCDDLLALLHTRSPFLCQGSFPGNLQLVLVLRPTTLLQRTLSDILFKFNKDEFKMKVPVRALWVSCAKTHLCLFHE